MAICTLGTPIGRRVACSIRHDQHPAGRRPHPVSPRRGPRGNGLVGVGADDVQRRRARRGRCQPQGQHPHRRLLEPLRGELTGGDRGDDAVPGGGGVSRDEHQVLTGGERLPGRAVRAVAVDDRRHLQGVGDGDALEAEAVHPSLPVPRSRSFTTAEDKDDGSAIDPTAGSSTCPVITIAAPASTPAFIGTASAAFHTAHASA